MPQIRDSATLSGVKITPEGYLLANARTARTGVQQYNGYELGRPDLGVVNVLRDEAEVFSKESLQTFSRLPITDDHPAADVNSGNWKDLAIGVTGDEVLRDGEFLKVGLKITDADAVRATQEGKRGLSVGYNAQIEWKDGVAPDGTPYQARQVGIKANHVAIVDRGRAGSEARIGDGDRESWGVAPITMSDTKEGKMPNDALKTVVLGDKAVQVAPADEAIIDAFKRDTAQRISDMEKTHTDALAAKDKDLATKDAEIKDLKEKQISDEDLDKLVADRAQLISDAKRLATKVDPAGKSALEIKRAALLDAGYEVKDKPEAYVDAAFDLALKSNPTKTRDTIRDAAATGGGAPSDKPGSRWAHTMPAKKGA